MTNRQFAKHSIAASHRKGRSQAMSYCLSNFSFSQIVSSLGAHCTALSLHVLSNRRPNCKDGPGAHGLHNCENYRQRVHAAKEFDLISPPNGWYSGPGAPLLHACSCHGLRSSPPSCSGVFLPGMPSLPTSSLRPVPSCAWQ